MMYVVFFFNDTATTEIYTLSLHDALPIWGGDIHNQNWVIIYAPVLPSLDVIPVSLASSLEQNYNALVPVNVAVVPYSTDQLTGLET